MLSESKIRRVVRQTLNEELNKTDVQGIINDKLKTQDFEKRIKEIVADCMTNLFKEMFQRDHFWTQAVKR